MLKGNKLPILEMTYLVVRPGCPKGTKLALSSLIGGRGGLSPEICVPPNCSLPDGAH